ncbi:MAG: hypothetical protein SOZ80_04280 [Prevotella sp.]|uniref:hypothetical protein n=1 Tax=Prevotella sp. TaxID=59823 RepID=UPI002A327E10|nr:hypothetical protein [Prevotella sp.]MDD7318953.1 hypothetical protein [Prevotellaceae bacterium]MDY4019979.1 hypothetical protein [Prevotella sp.]
MPFSWPVGRILLKNIEKEDFLLAVMAVSMAMTAPGIVHHCEAWKHAFAMPLVPECGEV